MNTKKQTFSAKSDGDKLDFYDKIGFSIWLGILKGKELDVSIGVADTLRTDPQNRGMHKYFTMVSDELNEQGVTVSAILSALKLGVELYPTPEIVKEIWRLFQMTQLKKQSTTELKKFDDINVVYESVCKFLGDNWNIYVEFPHKKEADPRYQ